MVSFFPQGLALEQKILCFGLLQSAEPILETGRGVSFHFLHQVFQEYLAALHIVKLPLDKQVEIIELEPKRSDSDINKKLLRWGLINNDGARLFMNMFHRSLRFSLVWRFFCDIYFSESNVEVQPPIVEYLMESLLTIKNILIMLLDGWLHLCLLAFEARNEIVSQKVLQSLHEAFKEMKLLDKQVSFPGQKKLIEPATNLIVLGRPFLSAYDCAAIVYLVSTIQECTTLKLIFTYSGIGEDSIRALADALANKNRELQIQRLSLDGNRLTDKCLNDLFGRASVAFKSLQTLEVSNNRIRTESLNSIAAPMEKLSFGRLLTLDLSLNPLGDSGVQALDKAARSNALANLVILNLQGSLTDDARINADLLNTFALFCHQLCDINFSQNNLGLLGAVALTKIIYKSKSFLTFLLLKTNSKAREAVHVAGPPFTMNISETKLDLITFITHLKLLLKDQIDFDALDLRDNGIQGPDFLCLIHAIGSSKIVIRHSLHLGDSHLGPKEAYFIGVMLSNCTHKFATLNLSRCQLTRTETSNDPRKFHSNTSDVIKIGQQLCQLPQTDILVDLNLDGNSFTVQGIHILAGFMHLCPCLKLLSCIDCHITSRDLLQLFDIVFGQYSAPNRHPCRELIGWYLDHNRIDDRGLDALLAHLPSLFPQLGCDNLLLNMLDNNPVSAEMTTRLKDEMKRRMEVRYCTCIVIATPFALSLLED